MKHGNKAYINGLSPAQYRIWLRARNTLTPKVIIGCRWIPGSTPRMPAITSYIPTRRSPLARLITLLIGK